MASEYYYLAAGLPDITLDKGKEAVDFPALVDDCAALVSPADSQLFPFIRYPYDHNNLLALLKSESDFTFDRRGNFNREQLEKQLKGIGELPDYMQLFIRAYQEKRPINSDLSWEDQLFELFFNEVLSLDNHFITEYYRFELDLRNVLAAINSRDIINKDGAAKKPLSAYLLGGESFKEQILRSGAPDFGLGPFLPWVEKIIALSKDNLEEYEKALDELRLSVIDDLAGGSIFGIEIVLATCLRAAIAQRWQNLDKESGEKTFKALLAAARGQFDIAAAIHAGTR